MPELRAPRQLLLVVRVVFVVFCLIRHGVRQVLGPGRVRVVRRTCHEFAGISGDQRNTVQTLKDNFSALSKDGKTFDLDTVKNIATTGMMPNGSFATPQLQQACQKFASDNALNFAADNAEQIARGRMDQRGDQKFSMKDLEKTLAR